MWTKSKRMDKFLQILLFLFAIGFMLQGTNIILLFFLILILLDGGKLRFSNGMATFFLLTGFAASYILMMMLYGKRGLLVIGCPVAFYIGLRLKDKTEAGARKVILLLSFGMASHVLLNFAYELVRFGTATFTSARHYDVWSQGVSTATGIMVNGTMLAGLLFYFLYIENRTKIKMAGLISLLILTIYDFILGGRTYLVLLALSMVVGLLLNIMNYGFNSKSFKMIGKILLITGITALALWLFYTWNQQEIDQIFKNSYFYHRFFREGADQVLFDTPRTSRKVIFILNMLNFPFGGNHLASLVGGRAHELWLDTYDEVGILPYVLLIIYTMASVVRLLKVLRSKSFDNEFKVLVGTVEAIILAQFFVEPVLSGAPILLGSYCLIDGVLTGVLRQGPKGKQYI